ncbi:MAG: hypothetical protein ABIA37_00830 [Candidatus Woesearchaeota archaeon]
MSSDKFLKIVDKLAVKNKESYDTLLEFEKTGKIRTKTKLTFTIDKAVASQFKKFCKEHGYNMSAKVEQAMNKVLKEKK